MSFLERLKAAGSAAKDFMLFILAPITALFVGAYLLLQKNKRLQAEIEQVKLESKTALDQKDADEKAKKSTISLDAYRTARDLYFKSKQRKP